MIDKSKLIYNEEPVCPYCGKIMSDAWELELERDGESTEVDCGNCGETYKVETNISRTYNTEPIVENKNADQVIA